MYKQETETNFSNSQFEILTSEKLLEILGLTIKKDETNKLITFLCQLSAYTENSQFNISFNAPSSTGKSYIPLEIDQLFPIEDVREVAYSSPTAFFHDHGQYDELKEGYVIDLSRKILIFVDQPHNDLLSRLRPLLSHDRKEITLKITDKNQKSGLRTKNIVMIGYPSVIFCTAGMKIDEQESTRMLLLSPEVNEEKLRGGIIEKIKKESDREAYKQGLDENPVRKRMQQRIRAIKQENISEIKIEKPELIEKRFLTTGKTLKPRHQRDIGHIISLIKSFALLNVWYRTRINSTLIANEQDIEEGFKLWDKISESQDRNIPPYIYNLYHDIIVPAYHKKNKNKSDGFATFLGSGLTRQDVMQQHIKTYGRTIEDWRLRQEIIPMLETAGLIKQESDINDKRTKLIYPLTELTKDENENSGTNQPITPYGINHNFGYDNIYSENEGGVQPW